MLARLLFIWGFLLSSVAFASGEVMYIHTDGLGSPVARTDKNGNLISRTRYEPYGATAAGATPTIGFTGHVNDPDTGLIYMQQRYYDPYAGRFLSTDPVLTDANTGSSFNRYVYANNSPFRYIDPDGRESNEAANADVNFQKATVQMSWFAAAMNHSFGGTGIGAAIAANMAKNQAKPAVQTAIKVEAKAAAPAAVKVTEASIKQALAGSDMKTAQEGVSLPAVERYVAKLANGETAPPIKVDGKVIVDGNHRYVAGQLAGKPVAQTPGTLPPSQIPKIQPIQNIKPSPNDWGNH